MMKIPVSLYKFVVSGGVATCIDFVFYYLLRQFIWASVAKTISFLIANVWSYMVNKRWVFSSGKDTDTKTIVSYAVVQLLNLITNVGVNSLMLNLTGYVFLSFVVATLCATIINYSLQKLIVFK
ncbi:MAG: GtrA family protein [Prevotella sp.]|jgi:putative flippase GtrA|nr:GtrA family protein [Prevotella sp.]MBQ7426593.1 GtrA family protein [Prevotella sp.]